MNECATRVRPLRYTLDVAVRYRRRGNAAWSDGIAVNASRSGVLFVANVSQPLLVGTRVEVRLDLGAVAKGGDVLCSGRIARNEQARPGEVRMAATIESYRFLKSGDCPATSWPLDG